MKKQIFFLTAVVILAAILRLWRLGEIPIGVSPEEENFIKFATPFFIRLPFSLIGILEVILIFTAFKKLSKSFSFSLIGAFFLAVLPWHIEESRIYSQNLLIFGGFLVLATVFSDKLILSAKRLFLISLVFSLILFFLSAPYKAEELKGKIHWQRDTVSKTNLSAVSAIFANKFIESYREKERFIFGNLDLGNYFFSGYPRPRGGVEEIPKLYLAILPLIFLGMATIDKNTRFFLFSWFAVSIFLPLFFNDKSAGAGLSLLFPIIFLSAAGIKSLFFKKGKKAKLFVYLLAAVLVFEILFFLTHYFSGFIESEFSPRRKLTDKTYIPIILKFATVTGGASGRAPDSAQLRSFGEHWREGNSRQDPSPKRVEYISREI